MRCFFRLISVALLLGLAVGLPAGAQTAPSTYRFEWAQVQHERQLINTPTQPIATDAQGNVYVVGNIRGGNTAQLDTLTLFNNNHTNSIECYLAKFSPAGRLLWVQRSDATGANGYWRNVTGVVVDQVGNVFVHGYGHGGMRFGNLQLPAQVGTPQTNLIGYVARFDTNGQGHWIRELPFPGNAQNDHFFLARIAPDNRGNCLLNGFSWNVDSIGTLPLAHTGTNDAFVLKMGGATGTFEWVRQIQGGRPIDPNQYNFMLTNALTADPAGNVLVAGDFGSYGDDSLRFSPTQTLIVTADSIYDSYVAKYDQNGQFLWVRQARGAAVSGGAGLVHTAALATDYLGNIFVAGSTTNSSFGPNASVTTFAGFRIPYSGYFLAKLDAAGTGQWMRSAFAANNFADWQMTLVVDAAGNPTVAGGLSGTTNLPVVTSSDLFVARYSATGQDQGTVYAGDSAPGHHNKAALGAALDATARELFLYVAVDTADVLGTLPIHVSGPALVLTKVNLQAANAYLGGTVYLDLNGNGRQDATEAPFPRQVTVEDSATRQMLVHYANAPTYGHDVAPGSYALRANWPQRPYYRTTQPGGSSGGAHRVAVPTAGLRVDTLAFGLAPIPGLKDLRVSLTAYTAARPGRVCRYRATVENLGTTTATGQLTVTFDPAATLLSTAPATTTQQGRTLTWNFQNLPPFGARSFDLAISLPVTQPLGSRVRSLALVSPVSGDETPADNTEQVEQTVTGSWDPNDLAVNFDQLTAAQVAAGQPLDYTVRFENLGTDTAFAVIIQDTLPASLLQLGTLELVGQSHNCRWTCTPAGVMTLRFPAIALPCQAANAFYSQGFVRFRIVPRTTLAGGVLIPNRAHIVFDYNAPLATNRATTVVSGPNGLTQDATGTAASMRLYPNPAAQQVTLTGLPLTAATLLTIRLFDALGREVRHLTARAPAGPLHQPLDLRAVAPGLYVVEMTAPGRAPSRQRLVVRGEE